MATLFYQDGVTEIVIQSVFHFDSRNILFRNFVEAIYNLHDVAPLGEYNVDTTALDTYLVAFDTSGGRFFDQTIQKTSGWFVRQQALSSFFTLQELLLNNLVRSAVQELIDGFSVTDIKVEFV